MTDLRQAAEMALEKLEFFAHMKSVSEDTMRLITALREALENEPQEPVDLLKQSEREGWRYANECELEIKRLRAEKREWVGLTDEEIQEMANDFEEGYVFLYRSFAAAIEAKLKEKNT